MSLADHIGTFAMNHPATFVAIGSLICGVIGGAVTYGVLVALTKLGGG